MVRPGGAFLAVIVPIAHSSPSCRIVGRVVLRGFAIVEIMPGRRNASVIGVVQSEHITLGGSHHDKSMTPVRRCTHASAAATTGVYHVTAREGSPQVQA